MFGKLFLGTCLVIVSCILVSFSQALPASAQESLTLELAPPLFRISIAPEGEWSSQFKVVNPNPFPITVLPRLADYEPFDDRPGGELISRGDADGAELFSPSLWVDIPAGQVNVPAESSKTIPLSLVIPEGAEPGTHTAAIVVGNIPDDSESSETRIFASVTSLLVITVLGDVAESGGIRSFTTESKTYTEPSAGFLLSFENTGNVHLEPKGEIVIANMWGLERGRIPIAVEEDLRLILPNTFHEFRFAWQGDRQGFDIGPYKAVASINYGDGDKLNSTASVWFWIIPWPQLLVVGSGLLFAALLLIWSIRALVMRIILREAMGRRVKPFGALPTGAVSDMRHSAVVDLRNAKSGDVASARTKMGTIKKKKSPKLVRIGLVLSGVSAIVIATVYGMSASTRERTYQIALSGDDGLRIVGQEELFDLAQDELVSGSEILTEVDENTGSEDAEVIIEVKILVQNGSGISGRASAIAELLEQMGFTTVSTENADRFDYQRTIIRYKEGRGAIAESIKVLLSVDPIIEEAQDLEEEVVVILGSDIE